MAKYLKIERFYTKKFWVLDSKEGSSTRIKHKLKGRLEIAIYKDRKTAKRDNWLSI